MFCLSGGSDGAARHPAHAADHPALPAGADAAGADLAAAAVLRHPAGPGAAQQVRVARALQAGVTARSDYHHLYRLVMYLY